jgi:hypothetical protein
MKNLKKVLIAMSAGLAEDGWKVQISLVPKARYKPAEYNCDFVKHFPVSQNFWSSGESTPHAICLAALKAKGVE